MAAIPLRHDPRLSPEILTKVFLAEYGHANDVFLVGKSAAIRKNLWTVVTARLLSSESETRLRVLPKSPELIGLVLAGPVAYAACLLVRLAPRIEQGITLAGILVSLSALVRSILGLRAAFALCREVGAFAQTEDFVEMVEAEEGDGPIPSEPTLGQMLRESYLTFDRRTLGFARIMLGVLLIGDLVRRTSSWEDMYSDKGVLPNHLNLFRPQAAGNFTILNAFSSPAELWVLWGLMLATFLCLMVGYKTRIAHILALVWVTSMDGRVLLVENGGYVVYNLLVLWTCFLPMGDRFSVDAMLASLRSRRETTIGALNDRTDPEGGRRLKPHVTVLGIVLLIQLAAIYFFNVVHKTGPAWHNGQAVHFVMYVDRMVTPIVGLVRDHIPNWGYIVLTKTTMSAETLIPLCLLSPLFRIWARRAAVVLINLLHLGFGTAMVLGPFAWALCVFSSLLFQREDWEIAIRTMRRTHRAREIVVNPRSGAAMFFARVLRRMDNFELLTFTEAEAGDASFAVRAPGGELRTGALALADSIAAVPLGPCIAWVPRLPGVRHVIDGVAGRLHRGDVSSFFGIKVEGPSRPVQDTPLRRTRTRILMVLREMAVLAMFAGAINQALTELWVVNRHWRAPQPEAMRLLSHKLRFLQGWFMFSPNPVMDDGTIVVDAITVDGRHIDPFTRKEPDYNLIGAKSLGYSQIWCDYYNRMHLPANTNYREAMKDYMYRLPERTGNPNDAIVSGDVYWIQDLNPKWGETESYKFEKNKLFSFENPAQKARAGAE